MKKIILLALAALLIFTMVSCDGNADFLLWNEEEEKYIILEFTDSGDYSFDSDSKVKTIKWVLEGNPSTFNDMDGETVKYYFGSEYEFTIGTVSGWVCLDTTQNINADFYLKLNDEYCSPDDSINYGSTYTIKIDYWT